MMIFNTQQLVIGAKYFVSQSEYIRYLYREVKDAIFLSYNLSTLGIKFDMKGVWQSILANEDDQFIMGKFFKEDILKNSCGP